MKDCKKVRLGDICEIIMGQSPNSQNYNNENIGLPLIQGNADIYKNHLSPHMFTSIITKTCEINDIIMSVRAPVGAVVIADIKACIGRGVCAIRTFENQKYIYQYLLYFKNKWKNISQGSTFESVNSNQIYNLSIPLPPIEEQQKIAEILSTQDKLIELKQKLIDKKKQQKKWLMQNLLTGKIRLKGFEGEWEKVKLGDICEFLDNLRKPVKENERISGCYPYYGASGIIDYVDNYIFDGEYILLGEDGANIIMRSTPLAFKVKGKIWVNNHAHVLQVKLGYNIDFIVNLLESINYDKYNSGTAQPKLNREVCENLILIVSTIEEQTAIAKILSTQDREIELLEKELEQEKLKKKALMQLLLTVK